MNVTGEVRYHLADKEYARAKFSEGINSFSIDIVFVPSPFRQRGIGKALVQRILAIADSVGKEVLVTVRPLGQSNEEIITGLISFYQRFGFSVTDRDPGLARMRRAARMPGVHPVMPTAGDRAN